MTLSEILVGVRKRKTCSLPQLKRYVHAVGLKPLGARQRPQNYPADSVEKIYAHLGFGAQPVNGHAGNHEDGKALVSLAKLKKARGKK